MSDIKFYIATANSRQAVQWRNKEVTWTWLVERCSETKRTSEKTAEYLKMDKNRQSEIKDVGGFVGGYLRGGRRKKGCVEYRTLATLDIDYGTQDVWDDFTMQFSCAALMYSTHKHTPEKPRLRLVIPFARRVTPEEYEPVCRKIAEAVGLDLFDTTTYETPRLFYWPSTPEDGQFVFEHQDGEAMDPDQILALYDNWHDASEWPMADREDETIRREIRKQEDPTEKPGIIGAFCRTYYPIEDALETFLRGVYEPTAIEGRYTYRAGSVAAGLVVYDGKFAYSHHETDPAGKKLCNAFDLVRIHKFGGLDEGKRTEEVTKLPSYQRMTEFAADDHDTRMTAVREARRSVDDDFADIRTDGVGDGSDDWMAGLTVAKNGKVESTALNALTVMENDPELRGRIRFDEFNVCVNVYGGLPWRKEATRWRDSDNSQLRLYMERTYGITGKDKIKDAKTACADNHRFHPVREYLDGLSWDGTRRIGRLLADCLGADDCPLNGRVMELWMAAAVERVMHPGCKFDYCLILTGPQGIGKSTLLEVLGGKWFNGNISAVGLDKSVLEQLAGSWVVELQELDSFRRSESTAIKSFITNTNDRFRGAYKEDSEDHPRQCVFAGTTNDAVFLKDDTGDRRFWVVQVKGGGNMTRDRLIDMRDQLWAEAVEILAGMPKGADGAPRIMLTREESDEMERRQKVVSIYSEDQTEALLDDFLETKLPADWAAYSVRMRQNYFTDEEAIRGKGTVTREWVCPAEFVSERLGIEEKDKEYLGRAAKVRKMLEKKEGWEYIGRKRYWYGTIHGTQKNAFKRMSDELDDDDL